MNKRHILFIPLLAVGALFSCNGNKNNEFSLDSVEVVLDDDYKTVKLGDKVDIKVIKQVNATYVKKDDSGEVTETKTEENVKGYTVKTDFSKPLDYTNVNDGFDVTVEYQGTKGVSSIDITSVFNKKTFECKTGDAFKIADIINSGFTNLTYKHFNVLGTNVITTIDGYANFTIEGSDKNKADLFAFKTIDEKTVLLDGCTFIVKNS